MERKYNKVKDVIDRRGTSQSWLAEQVGITKNAMNSIYKNKSQPRLETLFKIAEALEVDICDLIERGGATGSSTT